jgi:hypothetical protein
LTPPPHPPSRAICRALGALSISNVLFEHLQRKIVAAGVRARIIEIYARVREPVLQACNVLHERDVLPKRCTAELGRLPGRRGAWLRMRFGRE